jgi:CubicO group peptidase (beta-lactamase class C family)
MRVRSALGVWVSLAAAFWPHYAHAQQEPSSAKWAVSTPEKLRLDANVLARFDAEIARGKYGNIDSMLVIRHGRIAYDRVYKHDYDRIYREQARTPGALNAHHFTGPYNYFNPWWHPYYRRGDLHSLQSISKTVTSVVIGVAVDRQQFPSIDTPIMQYFSDRQVANLDDRKRRITIRHLLTMTSGFSWKEIEVSYDHPENSCSLMEASADWVQYAIDAPVSDEPGTRFNYNSGATILLAYIFHKITGQDIDEYAAKNLFAPLGIFRYHWKRTPWGLADSEGGLYLDRHDLAKIGYLFHRNGVWGGKQIISPDWIKASLASASTVPWRSGVKYGFSWWLLPYGKADPRLAFAGEGLGGQRLVVLPEYDLVLVVNAWNVVGEKSLGSREVIDRVLAAVKNR